MIEKKDRVRINTLLPREQLAWFSACVRSHNCPTRHISHPWSPFTVKEQQHRAALRL
jgi:hypothetical protein